ncbi:feruloyl-CoA synthase [uncultured Herbaspirillum sp.]|uniref:feruloyl-CoA synthase n=1 Tax=uncultured Herbaspirillum sp. TaxID=160236 RepID=UPI00258619EC|nr:feruloyl-CoA synthase [uncultured Herbaspirillum sp.]
MNTPPRYRSFRFGIGGVDVVPGRDGISLVKTRQPLDAYPARLTDKLIHWAKVDPDRTYMARRDKEGQWRRISYGQALQIARRIGQALLQRGLSAERPLLILSENDLEHAMLVLGCHYAGVPYAPVSSAYSLLSKDYAKLRHAVQLLTPGLIFAAHGEKFAAAVNAVAPDIEFVVTEAPPAGRECTLYADLEATRAGDEVERAYAATGPDTIVKFLFTSGSTKMPKAVINTQRMMCSNLQMIVQTFPFLGEEPPILIDWLPWNHTFGANHNVGIVIYNGGTMYIDEGKPTPQGLATTLANLHEISPTVYFNVPVGWEGIAHALEKDQALREKFYSRLRMQFYAGAALAQPVWDKLHATAEATCGERIVMCCGLGMTETSPSALFVADLEVQAGQIGIPTPGMEIKLVPNGDKIEIRYRGPNVTPGYWRAPEQTAEAFDEEGYFRSGDAVRWLDPQHPDRGFMFDGRVAEDFKLYTGTWVSVGPLRALIAHEGAPYLQDAVITGQDRKEIGMLIVPNIERCRQLARLPADASRAEVLNAAPVRDFFQGMLDRLQAHATGSSNRVTRALVLIDPPSFDRGEITDKGSINQRSVLTHRAALVEALYAGTDPAVLTAQAALTPAH